ncbi:MAG: tRNA (adenosine(37)-N6)-threonylcarbamoyltransferase complex ATPase subunit type 1 TsaE [Spirochaetota bacterium]|nr:MAG: tRNA (adenosine(37)-N6)-threonylcarbamoyltransferase complex ATPase subunit type 1 TsaE [Spirochaetota bacterium]
MVETVYRSSSFQETINFGQKLGKTLNGGELILLTGVLGSGKTVITKGIALALGIKSIVTSPSFAIMNEYKGKLWLYHFDFYRIDDRQEMEDLLEDYIYRKDGIAAIEWGEKVEGCLESYIRVDIDIDDLYRTIKVERR